MSQKYLLIFAVVCLSFNPRGLTWLCTDLLRQEQQKQVIRCRLPSIPPDWDLGMLQRRNRPWPRRASWQVWSSAGRRGRSNVTFFFIRAVKLIYLLAPFSTRGRQWWLLKCVFLTDLSAFFLASWACCRFLLQRADKEGYIRCDTWASSRHMPGTSWSALSKPVWPSVWLKALPESCMGTRVCKNKKCFKFHTSYGGPTSLFSAQPGRPWAMSPAPSGRHRGGFSSCWCSSYGWSCSCGRTGSWSLSWFARSPRSCSWRTASGDDPATWWNPSQRAVLCQCARAIPSSAAP